MQLFLLTLLFTVALSTLRKGPPQSPHTRVSQRQNNIIKDDDFDDFSKPLDVCSILTKLAGTWEGSGFNVIAVPHVISGFDVLLAHTKETLTFSKEHKKVRNAVKTAPEGEFFLTASVYNQQIFDQTTGNEIHIEPGLFFCQPAFDGEPDMIWRAGNIPHGNSILASTVEISRSLGAPEFENITAIPTLKETPDIPLNESYISPYTTPTNFPTTMNGRYHPTTLMYPAKFLEKDIERVEVLSHIMFEFDSSEAGGILNIPFVKDHSDAPKVEAIFYLEKVRQKNGDIEWWLQYLQYVTIDFPSVIGEDNISWPHVSVATLKKKGRISSRQE